MGGDSWPLPHRLPSPDLAAQYDLDSERAEALAGLLPDSVPLRRGGRPAWEAGGRLLVQVERHGSLTVFDPVGPAEPPRPLFQVDRYGNPVWAIARDAQGRLVRAKLRAFDGRWIGVMRGATDHPLWGTSDPVVALATGSGFEEGEPLAVFQTVDYEDLRFIPPLDRPAALPPGAGAALLNLLAFLLREQGGGGIRYRGPYPTDHLFDALLDSFRPRGEVAAARRRFTAEVERRALEARLEEAPPIWLPAPHERIVVGEMELQMRRGLEAVRWRGRTYRAKIADRSPGPLQVVRIDRGWCAGLVLLGELVEEHLHLDRRGEVLCQDEPPGSLRAGPALGPLWKETLEAALLVRSPSLLVSALRRVLAELEWRWGEVPGGLVHVEGERVVAAGALVEQLHRRLARAAAREERAGLAAQAVGELLEAIGPPVRRLAQAWLEALSLEEQIALLTEGAADARADAKARLGTAFPALCNALTRGEGLP